MKVIVIDTPRGQYSIPLRPVAEHRADYYACEKDGEPRGGDAWKEEVDYVMNDPFEGIDWLIGQTDWSAWETSATKINDKVLVTDDDFWTSSDDFHITTAQNGGEREG
jgi:enolase